MREISTVLTCLTLAAAMTAAAHAQSGQQGAAAPSPSPVPSPQAVPVMDGGAGPCSLELTITADDRPVAAANVKVHIAYGFAGARRLDLDAYTNNDGKLKFTGLPSRVKRPPLEFRATKDKLTGTAPYDPESECNAKHAIALVQPAADKN